MTKLLPFGVLLVCMVFTEVLAAGQPTAYPQPKFGDTGAWGRNVQRTMRLLATSTPQKRNTVRILFYGQSITEQAWWPAVADDLRTRFPQANLVIENRALGGFASQMLVKTAETDLYPFYPDLLIFQVYGAHDKYEDIIRRVRQRTTAEILQQNDHVTSPADFNEETDPAKLWPPNGKHWNAFMNHNWLPAVSRRYGTEFCDQRGLWKQYLADNGLEPKQLLKDGVHLNAHGEFLMAQCVKAYLRYDPGLGASAADRWVKTYEVGKDIAWRDGLLRLAFEGNRVEVIVKPGSAPPGSGEDRRSPTLGLSRTLWFHAHAGQAGRQVAARCAGQVGKTAPAGRLDDGSCQGPPGCEDVSVYGARHEDGAGRRRPVRRAVRVAVGPGRDRAGGLERGLRPDVGRRQTRARAFYDNLERSPVLRRPVRFARHRGSKPRDFRDSGPGASQRQDTSWRSPVTSRHRLQPFASTVRPWDRLKNNFRS